VHFRNGFEIGPVEQACNEIVSIFNNFSGDQFFQLIFLDFDFLLDRVFVFTFRDDNDDCDQVLVVVSNSKLRNH
jgi:hypothetical protein